MARLLFLISTLLLSVAVHAESKPACDNTYFFVLGDFWPIASRAMGAEAKGLGYDVATEIGSRTGCRVVISLVPPNKTWKALEDGKADVILGIEDSSPEAKFGTFIPILQSRRILVLNRKVYRKDWNIQNYIDAPKIRFSGIINSRFAYQKGEIDTLKKQHLYLETTDHDNLLDLIAKGQADATFFTQGAFADYKKRIVNTADLVTMVDEQNWLIAGFYVSKKRINQAQLSLIENTVRDIQGDGTMEKFFTKYVGQFRAKEIMNYKP